MTETKQTRHDTCFSPVRYLWARLQKSWSTTCFCCLTYFFTPKKQRPVHYRFYFLLLPLMGVSLFAHASQENRTTITATSPATETELTGVVLDKGHLQKNGNILGWKPFRATLLPVGEVGYRLFSIALYKDDKLIFSTQKQQDERLTIIDTTPLPQNKMTHRAKNGKIIKNNGTYFFENYCDRLNHEIIVGLVRPAPGKENCIHTSKHVLQAWKIDKKSGHIINITTDGVSCQWTDAENPCE